METVAPFYNLVAAFIGRRTDPDPTLTFTSRGMLIEVRKELTIEVPCPKRLPEGIQLQKVLWHTEPGDVLMPYYSAIDDDLRMFLEIFGPLPHRKVKKVMHTHDIFDLLRQQSRHVLDGLISKREKIRGHAIVIPGEHDQLIGLLKKMRSSDEVMSGELMDETERVLGASRNAFKRDALKALKAGDLTAADQDIRNRLREIIEESEGILNRVREITRIIRKIQYGFDTAYVRMYRIIEALESSSPDAEKIKKLVQEEIYLYLTRRVGAFNPFYSYAHQPEVEELVQVSSDLDERNFTTAVNRLKRAMSAIEKGVKGIRPDAIEIQRIHARVTRRVP